MKRQRQRLDTGARIEVGAEEMPRLLDEDVRRRVTAELREAGYLYVTLDLMGYQTGSLNAGLRRDGGVREKPSAS